MTNNIPHRFFVLVNDPHVERTQKHRLDSILFISLCAVICGAESRNEIEDYGHAKIDWLEKFCIYLTGYRHMVFSIGLSVC
ncbi:MAG: transposase family protein [Bacteroides sp.]|nr:transposase family protein [Bacteroides sp.]